MAEKTEQEGKPIYPRGCKEKMLPLFQRVTVWEKGRKEEEYKKGYLVKKK